MINSYKNILKMSVPGESQGNTYVINVYRHGEFKMAYKYVDWTEDAVNREVSLLENRFSSASGFSVVK